MIKHARLSRRTVVGGMATVGTIAAVGVVTQKGTALGGPDGLARTLVGGARPSSPLATAEMTAWQAAVGSEFAIARSTHMRLVGVQPLASRGARPRGLRRNAFLAVFELPAFAQLPGDLIYTLSNPAYGALDLFLVEGGARGAQRLHAVFN